MKKVLLFTTAVFLWLTIMIPVTAAKDVQPAKDAQAKPTFKIGIVDMQRIARESKTAKAVRGDFLKEMEAKKAQIIEKMKDVQKQEEELSRLDPNTPIDTKRQKSDKLKYDTRDLNNLRQDAEAEAKRKDAEITQTLFVEIMKIIRNYAKTERYSIIFERGTVVTAEESFDITEKILKIFDAQKK
jgi:outer membrane protein